MVEQHDPGVVVGVGDGVKGRHHYAPLLPVSPLGLALVEVPGEAALAKIGVELTELRKDQASYIGVNPEGPFKPEYYRY